MSEDVRDAVLETLWGRALETWDDETKHVAVLQYAAQSEAMPELASRYRALVDDPARGPMARRRLDAIVAKATAMMCALKTPAPTRVPLPITLSGFAVSALLLTWLAWSVWGSR
jgi:hypothetical protein